MRMSAREIWSGFEVDGPEWVIRETPVELVPEDLRSLWSSVQVEIEGQDLDDLSPRLEARVDEVIKTVSDMIWGPAVY